MVCGSRRTRPRGLRLATLHVRVESARRLSPAARGASPLGARALNASSFARGRGRRRAPKAPRASRFEEKVTACGWRLLFFFWLQTVSSRP